LEVSDEVLTMLEYFELRSRGQIEEKSQFLKKFIFLYENVGLLK